MAQLYGTNIADTIVMFDDQETFATHNALYGKGGLRTVATVVHRNNISPERRDSGMLVWVSNTGQFYRLKEGHSTGIVTTDNDWITVSISPDEIVLTGVTGNQSIYTTKTSLYSKIVLDVILQNATNNTLHTTLVIGTDVTSTSLATGLDFTQGDTLIIGTEPNNLFNANISGIGSSQIMNLILTTTDTLSIKIKLSNTVGVI